MITIKEQWDFIRDELPPTKTEPGREDLHKTVRELANRLEHLEKKFDALKGLVSYLL